MPVLVDSNVILDVAEDDPVCCAWSREELSQAAESSQLVINPVICAEVSIGYSRIEDLEAALPEAFYRHNPLAL